MLKNYTIEAYNIEKNRWDVFGYARTKEEAIEKAQEAIGYSKAHDTVEILDMQGLVIWESDEPETRMKNVGLETQEKETT
jgi:hypothetical protein